jgi:type VI secretion system protein ImpC
MSKAPSAVAAVAATTTTDAPAAAGAPVSGLSAYTATHAALVSSAAATTGDQASQMLEALATAIKLPGASTEVRNGTNYIDGLLAQIDQHVNEQLNEVIHAPEFLKLEGTWRGLQRLLQQTDSNATLWVEMMDTTKGELLNDFNEVSDYSQSALWKKAYEGRYDQSGGRPYGTFVSGFDFENRPDDIKLLTNFARIGGATQAPFVLSASPKLLGLRSFEDLKNIADIKNVMNEEGYTAWNNLRKDPDSRFLAMTLPRVLARMPYGTKTELAEGLPNFEEAPISARGKLAKMPNEHLCWSSSAYAMGSVITKAFRQTNWVTAIVGEPRGKLNGGTVGALPLYQYYNEGGSLETTIPTETVIPGDKEFGLAQLGFLPLSYEIGSTRAVFVGGKTLFQPGGMKGSDEFENQFVASVLANVLPASRIAHYMKRICRKFHGRFATGDELKRFMNDWLAQFKTDESTGEEGKVSHPIKDFTVDVKKGFAPGVYETRLTLKFWDMIYQVNADVEMVAKLDNK